MEKSILKLFQMIFIGRKNKGLITRALVRYCGSDSKVKTFPFALHLVPDLRNYRQIHLVSLKG
jgi:hypothetical protein